MQIVLSVISDVIFMALWAMLAVIWARVLLGYFLTEEGSVLCKALKFLTDPVLLPVRAVLDRMHKSDRLLDLSAVAVSAVILTAMALLPAGM